MGVDEPPAPDPASTVGRGPAVQRAIHDLLESGRIPFSEQSHPPVRSGAEAAQVRGTPLELGVKAVLFKIDGSFRILALRAHREVSSRALRHTLGARRTRFASEAELWGLLGLERGAVPPFGRPILPAPLLVDRSVGEREAMLFTPGVATVSIRVATSDYLELLDLPLSELSRPS